MRVIDIIEKAMNHNELLVKVIKGGLWFQDKSISEKTKEKESERYKNLVTELGNSCSELERSKITFNDLEAIDVIELPTELKRKDIEIWLESWRDFKKNKKAV